MNRLAASLSWGSSNHVKSLAMDQSVKRKRKTALLFPKIGSYYVALASLERTAQTRLASDMWRWAYLHLPGVGN